MFLGSFEDGINSYWLLIDSSEVWTVRGYEGDPEEHYGLVNTSSVVCLVEPCGPAALAAAALAVGPLVSRIGDRVLDPAPAQVTLVSA